jgi:hypothetical protein
MKEKGQALQPSPPLVFNCVAACAYVARKPQRLAFLSFVMVEGSAYGVAEINATSDPPASNLDTQRSKTLFSSAISFVSFQKISKHLISLGATINVRIGECQIPCCVACFFKPRPV